MNAEFRQKIADVRYLDRFPTPREMLTFNQNSLFLHIPEKISGLSCC
jgi:hypothetical protein